MSKDLLLRFFRSDHFNKNPFLTVAYLARYHNNIGIHHFLCHQLRQFDYDQIEFYIPQLCHLIVSVSDAESIALEDYLIELCEKSAHGALITHLHDLSKAPQANAFKTCCRVYNKVQHIVFGSTESTKEGRLHENVLPITMLASLILGGVAAPVLTQYAGPLAISQARKPPKTETTISEPPTPTTTRITRSKTIGSTSARGRKERKPIQTTPDQDVLKHSSPPSPRSSNAEVEQPQSPTKTNALKAIQRRISLRATDSLQVTPLSLSSHSLPDLRLAKTNAAITKEKFMPNGDTKMQLKSVASMTLQQKINLLRTNYFHNQTQLLLALEDISNRLILVPKAARLSALRAELALLNEDLPAEVDIPVLCHSLGSSKFKDSVSAKYHRIVRINPAEATVLNSAERVPYLIMVEVLLCDFDFDPDQEDNELLLHNLVHEGAGGKRRIFDITESSRIPSKAISQSEGPDSVYESTIGDIGASPLNNTFDDNPLTRRKTDTILLPVSNITPRSSGTGSIATSSILTPRSSGLQPARTSSPAMGKRAQGSHSKGDQPDLSALATHMRTAAHMLAQLDASSSKRPKDEVSAIKTKIIASMQALEEQSFFLEDEPVSTFENIIDNANNAQNMSDEMSAEDIGSSPSGLGVETGAARMENDSKTAGIERKGDKDDPSAATFGEEWKAKRERIRKSSPYGLYKNWDLISVIVKTGGDLRQEAFACQLIQFCGKIWEAADIPVWVRTMQILVTGESSGLIETITNGVSLHSLKRSLTLASIQSGKNPKGKFASLRDHFIQTFGEPDTKTYAGAVDAFTKSLAAASIICYVFQLKDRHNGNILVDNEGRSLGFEAAPFKLTQEYVDVLGGPTSQNFEEFRRLCKKAFQALRKSADNLVMFVELMGRQSAMPCFGIGVNSVVTQLRARFQLQLSEAEAETFVDTDLIGKSIGSYYTRMYDAFQYRTQGIY